jgi:hypothetical protein
MAQVQEVFLFSPLSVATTCQLWLDAADSSRITTSGGFVTAWGDKSPNARSITPVSANTIILSSQNNLTTLNFGNNRMTNASFAWSSVFTTIIVAKSSNGAFLFSQQSGSTYNRYVFTGNGSLLRVTQTSLLLVDDSVIPDGTPVTASNEYFIFILGRPSGANFGSPYRINGTARSTEISANTPTDGTTTNPLWINGNSSGGSSPSEVAEILFYSSTLSTSDCEQLEGYLAWKWGLQGSLPSNHPFRNYRPLAVPPIPTQVPNAPYGLTNQAVFLPTQLSGCQLWLDAADVNGTGTNPAVGSTLASWTDKSSNAYTATSFGSPTLSTNNSLPCVNFTTASSQYFRNSAISLNMSQMTVFLVGYNAAGISSSGGLLSLVPIANGVDFNQSNAITYNFSTTLGQLFITFNFSVSGYNQNFTSTANPILFTHVQNGTSITLYNLGTAFNNATLNFTPGTTTGYSVGARFQNGNGTANAFLSGRINEIIIYNTPLSDSQRQQVERYLAWKWLVPRNLQTAIAPFQFRATPFVGSLTQWLPNQISGLSLWLDANDVNGNGTNSAIGSTLASWKDKSINAYTGTSSGSPTLALNNSLPCVSFNGSSQYFNFGDVADLGASQLFIFTVAKFNTTGQGTIIAKSVAADAIYRYSLLRESGSIRPLIQSDTIGVANNAGVVDTSVDTRIISMTWNRTTIQLFFNGSLSFSTGFSSSATFNSAYLLLIGVYNGPVLYFNGILHEVVMYFGSLSNSQRQQVEGYLAWKWGLQTSLPGGHPYRLFPPPP